MRSESPYIFCVAYNPGEIKEFEDILMGAEYGSHDLDVIIDPVSQIKDDEKLIPTIHKMIEKHKIVSGVTYRIRPGDNRLMLDQFHQTTLVNNNSKNYCIDRAIFAKNTSFKIAELNKETATDIIRQYQKGLHFFATNSKE